MYIFGITARSPAIYMDYESNECVSSCLLQAFSLFPKTPLNLHRLGNLERQRIHIDNEFTSTTAFFNSKTFLMKRRSKLSKRKEENRTNDRIVCKRDFKRENAMSKDSISLFNKTEFTIFSTVLGIVRISISFCEHKNGRLSLQSWFCWQNMAQEEEKNHPNPLNIPDEYQVATKASK